MSTPVLTGLKKKYPDCRIVYFVEYGFEAGLEKNPDCDEIFRFKRKQIRDALWRDDGIEGINKLKDMIEELNEMSFDIIINLSQLPYISFLMSLVKSKKMVGKHFLPEGNHAIDDYWSQYLYAIPFARRYNSLHASDVYRRIAGVTDHNGYRIEVDENEKADSAEYLRSKGVDITNKSTIIFQPGAAIPSKRWGKENFICLGKLLSEKGWQIIISGAPSERELSVEIGNGIGNQCFITAGETSFRQAIVTLAFSNCCVTGDTALMHAASALGVRVFALFGPTNPVETGPYGEGHFVFSSQCSDRPCFSNTCKSYQCMKSIQPETVLCCIEKSEHDKNSDCDVYRTSLEYGKDYCLKAVRAGGYKYYDDVGSAITRCVFDENGHIENENADKNIKETEEFISAVQEMEELLKKVIIGKKSKYITLFEQKKRGLSIFKEIGAFWTAILNLRLNSIPLVDPMHGVKLSANACSDTIRQIDLLYRYVSHDRIDSVLPG